MIWFSLQRDGVTFYSLQDGGGMHAEDYLATQEGDRPGSNIARLGMLLSILVWCRSSLALLFFFFYSEVCCNGFCYL